MVFITGEAGIGKTALINQVDVIEAHCDILVRREQFVRARNMDILA